MNDESYDSSSIQAWCVRYVAKILDVAPERIDPRLEIDRLGLDSSTAVAMVMSLEEWLGIELMPELLFEYPTLAGLSNHLATRVARKSA